MISALRRISIVESVSYVLLLIAAIVKRSGGTELGVTVFGPLHGVLFLVFAAMFLRARLGLGWHWSKVVSAILIGSLPLGGFWVDRQWLAPLQ